MSRRPPEGVLRHLRYYMAVEQAGEVSDGLLLERFVSRRDESAFAALVHRYGALVMGVCRRILRHEQDAEDAFQATFLVLARKAVSLDGRGSLAGYLHTVAYRAALKAREAAARRQVVPLPLEEVPAREGAPEREWQELRGVLDEELARLPERYRAPLLLCDLQGKTHGQAGRELGQPLGSMSRLLARGRELLRDRLAHRGLTLPAAGLAVLLAEQAQAAAPRCLDDALTTAATWRGAGPGTTPARAAEIARGVLADLSWPAHYKIASALLLAVGLIGAAAGLLPAQPRGANALPLVARLEKEAGAESAESPLPPRALARLGTSRFRHAGIVPALTYSPDGKVLVSGSHLGTIRVWDPQTGKELRLIKGPPGICSLAISPDSKWLASGSWDRSIRLWDLSTGAPLRVLLGHAGEVTTLRFSPDGKVLASGSRDGMVRLWEPGTGMPTRSISAHKGEVRCVAFSPDGKRLATGGPDNLVRLWEADTGKEVLSCVGHKDRVNGVAFAPDGKSLASCGKDQTVRLWDLTGKETRVLPQIGWLEALAFSPDGKSLAVSCGWGCEVRLWDLTAKRDTPRWKARQQLALALAFSPDGKKLAGSAWESAVRVWDVATGKEEGAAAVPAHTGWVYATVALPDGKTIVSGGSDGQVLVWDGLRGKEMRRLEGHTDRVNCLAVSADGKTLASGGRDKKVRLWDLSMGKALATLDVGGSVKSLSFSPDGKLLASASGKDQYDGWVQEVPGHGAALWDVGTGRRLVRLEGHTGSVNAVAFAPDGKVLATAGSDRSVRFWDTTGKELRRLPAQPGVVECLAFSPDGTTLAVGGEAGLLRLWGVESGKLLRTFPAPANWVVRLAFAPDGRTLISATREDSREGGPLRLWDVATGKERARFAGHQATAFGVTFSPDGRRVISGGGDAAVLLWDVTGRVEKGTFVNAELTPAQLKSTWEDLGEEGAKAHQAVWTLVSAPKESLPFLREALKPVKPVDGKRIDRLISDLDDDDFNTREKASEELEQIGEPAIKALQKAAEAGPSAEVRTRARRLLEVLQGKPAQERTLRQARGVEVLEHLGGAGARRVLQELAGGAADAALSRDAKAALARLTKGVGAP